MISNENLINLDIEIILNKKFFVLSKVNSLSEFKNLSVDNINELYDFLLIKEFQNNRELFLNKDVFNALIEAIKNIQIKEWI